VDNENVVNLSVDEQEINNQTETKQPFNIKELVGVMLKQDLEFEED